MRENKLYYPHSQSFCTLDIQTDIYVISFDEEEKLKIQRFKPKNGCSAIGNFLKYEVLEFGNPQQITKVFMKRKFLIWC